MPSYHNESQNSLQFPKAIFTDFMDHHINNRGVLRTFPNNYDLTFLKNTERLKLINYFHKKSLTDFDSVRICIKKEHLKLVDLTACSSDKFSVKTWMIDLTAKERNKLMM